MIVNIERLCDMKVLVILGVLLVVFILLKVFGDKVVDKLQDRVEKIDKDNR